MRIGLLAKLCHRLFCGANVGAQRIQRGRIGIKLSLGAHDGLLQALALAFKLGRARLCGLDASFELTMRLLETHHVALQRRDALNQGGVRRFGFRSAMRQVLSRLARVAKPMLSPGQPFVGRALFLLKPVD